MADIFVRGKKGRSNCSDCSFSAPTFDALLQHRQEKHKNIKVVGNRKKNETVKPSRQKLKGSGMLHGRKCATRENMKMLRARIGTHLQEEGALLHEQEKEPHTLYEPGLDTEVMKRLCEMVPDTVAENLLVDNMDEPTSHRLRLIDRLRANDLMEIEVAADGNCQFRALSDQLYRSSEHHIYVRNLIVNQLKSHQELYVPYVVRDYGEYLEDLSRSGSWGDNVTLKAAADLLGIRIIVIQSHPDVSSYQIDPNDGDPTRVIRLSFNDAAMHYNSVYHIGEDAEEDPPDQDVSSDHIDEAASDRQRLFARLEENEKEAPAPIVRATSWISCCCLFEVLFGCKTT